MSKRKLLYGYQIQNGELTVVKAEASVVARVASLYLEGLSYQKLADLLNQEHIPFSKEVPVWDKHKVKRLLENPRYTGQNGYPGILDTETFQCVQSRIQEKTAKQTPKAERQILKLADRLHCASCGSTLYRMGGKNHRKDTLYLKCAHCGITITIQDEILLEEVIHQMEEWDRPEQTSYQPSGEVIRLTNAINRGLEHPDDPQEVISLILQGVAARYACCPDTQEHTNRPLDVCWDHIRLAVSHINISEENTVKVTFQQEHRERIFRAGRRRRPEDLRSGAARRRSPAPEARNES